MPYRNSHIQACRTVTENTKGIEKYHCKTTNNNRPWWNLNTPLRNECRNKPLKEPKHVSNKPCLQSKPMMKIWKSISVWHTYIKASQIQPHFALGRVCNLPTSQHKPKFVISCWQIDAPQVLPVIIYKCTHIQHLPVSQHLHVHSHTHIHFCRQ